jgi:hypothetical protein
MKITSGLNFKMLGIISSEKVFLHFQDVAVPGTIGKL